MLWIELPTNMKMFYKVLLILLIGFSITAAAPPQAVDNVLPACDPVCCDRYYIYDRVKGYCTLDLDLLRGDKVYDGNQNIEDEIENLKSFGNVADIPNQDEMAKTSEAGSKNASACDPVCCRTRLYYIYDEVKGCTLDWKLLMEAYDKYKTKHWHDAERRWASCIEKERLVLSTIVLSIVSVVIAIAHYCKYKCEKQKTRRKASKKSSVLVKVAILS